MSALREILGDVSANWARRPPASENAIRQLQASSKFPLPREYEEFLRYSDGGEGPLCIEPWYFRLCAAEDVISYNQGYRVETFLPGFFAIGSNAGSDMIAIRISDGSPCPIYMVPFIPMSKDDAVEIAYDFEMFAMAFGREVNVK
jgi:hypothetical protein